jgi:diaminopropionate ammonia-lyase
MPAVELALNYMRKDPGGPAESYLSDFQGYWADRAYGFHQGIPGYAPTPLHSLPNLAKRLNLSAIWVKDESKRFSLNAFKVLGGSYAIGAVLAEQLGKDLVAVGWTGLADPKTVAKIGSQLFVTATDGNHGRGVAWAATALGHRALVLMPKGSAIDRVKNILATGAECLVTDLGYDETVLLAAKRCQELKGILVQDSGWPGYVEIPTLITRGYMTVVEEVLAALPEGELPTHVFVQCGVGSFPAAVLGRLANALGAKAPKGIIVEPFGADCLYRSIAAGDGQTRSVPGELNTLMAGLACGVPSALSWPILRDQSFAAVRCEDFVAANGMRLLASPLPGDPAIESGESGAVGAGLIELILGRPGYEKIALRLGLGPTSKVLLISTEGATAAEDYRQIVWRGRCPEPM